MCWHGIYDRPDVIIILLMVSLCGYIAHQKSDTMELTEDFQIGKNVNKTKSSSGLRISEKLIIC